MLTHPQISFMCSNGSRQVVHRRSAVHAVGPKRDSSSVARDPHCGQGTTVDGASSVSGIGPSVRGAPCFSF